MSSDTVYKLVECECGNHDVCDMRRIPHDQVYLSFGDRKLYALFDDGAECACMGEVEAV
jgi:hypothetical protein